MTVIVIRRQQFVRNDGNSVTVCTFSGEINCSDIGWGNFCVAVSSISTFVCSFCTEFRPRHVKTIWSEMWRVVMSWMGRSDAVRIWYVFTLCVFYSQCAEYPVDVVGSGHVNGSLCYHRNLHSLYRQAFILIYTELRKTRFLVFLIFQNVNCTLQRSLFERGSRHA